MPEGDTLHRTARALAAAMNGKKVLRLTSSKISPVGIVGRRVASVTAVGKHLLIALDDGRAIRAHLRMTGSFRVNAPGSGHGERAVRIAIDVGEEQVDATVVGVAVPTLEVVKLDAAPAIERLGPDVLAQEFDAERAVANLRALGEREIGDAILDQNAVSGIGNIYKSETLFTLGVNPFAPVRTLDDRTLNAIVQRARRLMHANLNTRSMRTTGRGQRYWVYERKGLACGRCGAIIEMRRQGELRRSTYYCPRCQP